MSLAAPEEAEREGDRSLPALSACLQVGAHRPYIHLYLTWNSDPRYPVPFKAFQDVLQ